MATERFIENNVIRNQASLGFSEAPVIRRCRAGRGYGIVDLLFLPASGAHDIVLVEAKRASSPDALAKVVGQLLLYRAGLSRLGSAGLKRLRRFATSDPARARSLSPKYLKRLSGGVTPPETAWEVMQRGERIRKNRIALWIALDATPPAGLMEVLRMLAHDHSLPIGIISVLALDAMKLWSPMNPTHDTGTSR